MKDIEQASRIALFVAISQDRSSEVLFPARLVPG
jgi:hypothetical protein